MGGITYLMLTNVAVAAGLAAVALLTCSIIRRAEFVHKVWLVVILKLIAPSLLVLPVLPSLSHEKTSIISSAPFGTPDVRANLQSPVELDNIDDLMANDVLIPSSFNQSKPIIVGDLPPIQSPAEQMVSDHSLAWAWAAGAVGYWLFVAVGAVQFHRRMRSSALADEAANTLTREVADRLGMQQVPRVEISPHSVSPMVWAAFARPLLILPQELWNRLTAAQRETILAHELAHVARRDHWVRRLEVLILGCYWWCPIAWFARARLRRAEEACCDQRVLRAYPESAQAYAEALIETAMFVTRPSWAPLASGSSATAGELKRRVTMILSNRPNRGVRRPIAAVMMILGVALLALRPGFSQERSPSTADTFQVPAQPTQPTAQLPSTPAPSASPIIEIPRISQHDQPAAPAQNVVRPLNVQQLRDEIETLEAQRHTKQAHLQVARAMVEAAQRKSDILKKTGGTPLEANQADDEVNIARAKLIVHEAELQEHEVRIKQAKRKLEATSNVPTSGPYPVSGLVGVRNAVDATTATLTKPAQPFTPKPADPAATATYTGTITQTDNTGIVTLMVELTKLKNDQAVLETEIKKVSVEYKRLRSQMDQLTEQKSRLESMLEDLNHKSQPKPPAPKQ